MGPKEPLCTAPLPHVDGKVERSIQVIDTSRKEQQLVRFRKDECTAAEWIHEVTGDQRTGAVCLGQCTLQEALQSGEVLCDLVNAVWPGRITGILRGNLKSYRLVNITRFVQTCSELGVEERSVFAPPALIEGKNLKSVVRCIFAL